MCCDGTFAFPPTKHSNSRTKEESQSAHSASSEQCPAAQKAQATDMAFFMSRTSKKQMPSWILYNQKASTVNPEKTTVGYLPIIQAPASELDTLNTVVKRMLHISKSMEQQWTRHFIRSC
ncbi:hypothetical protein F7725_013474 [Dissostichus mawsoni]|uniref:Uncharacterized protein n=1 Tax=Dissostichus mawsoni TaxID=36200 RepID=A0A7J5YQ56_DISMA|nr:hypothetical protein F7725_013474 [Dissostichus mawsoni]